jgi:hypothetical protein
MKPDTKFTGRVKCISAAVCRHDDILGAKTVFLNHIL